MEKTRIGISVGLFAALLYLMGILNLLGLVIMAGYVLFFENSDFLRKAAVRALVIYVVFSLISVAFGMIDNVFGILNVMIGWIASVHLHFPLNLDQIVLYVAGILKNLLLIVLAALALGQKTVPLGPLDSWLSKHIGSGEN